MKVSKNELPFFSRFPHENTSGRELNSRSPCLSLATLPFPGSSARETHLHNTRNYARLPTCTWPPFASLHGGSPAVYISCIDRCSATVKLISPSQTKLQLLQHQLVEYTLSSQVQRNNKITIFKTSVIFLLILIFIFTG